MSTAFISVEGDPPDSLTVKAIRIEAGREIRRARSWAKRLIVIVASFVAATLFVCLLGAYAPAGSVMAIIREFALTLLGAAAVSVAFMVLASPIFLMLYDNDSSILCGYDEARLRALPHLWRRIGRWIIPVSLTLTLASIVIPTAVSHMETFGMLGAGHLLLITALWVIVTACGLAAPPAFFLATLVRIDAAKCLERWLSPLDPEKQGEEILQLANWQSEFHEVDTYLAKLAERHRRPITAEYEAIAAWTIAQRDNGKRERAARIIERFGSEASDTWR